MVRNANILRGLFIALVAIPILFTTYGKLPAGFSRPETKVHVEIDGVDYGPFDRIEGLEKFAIDGYPESSDNTYEKITLSRDFVTDPSLYLWAKNRMSRKFGLKDIHLIKEDEEGRVVGRQILQLCQPLSWSVEATNPSLGGFNETIDLAVQKITVF